MKHINKKYTSKAASTTLACVDSWTLTLLLLAGLPLIVLSVVLINAAHYIIKEIDAIIETITIALFL